MKEKFEVINLENEARTGLIYNSVKFAKSAATKMNWSNIQIGNGYRTFYKSDEKKIMKDAIRSKYEGIPEKQISAGVYLHTIGRKYITVMNTWNGTKLEKIEIEDFYHDYM